MTLQQMLYVKIIAETQSINKASQVLHLSQPALTKQLKLLENELGATLFERNQNGVRLTKEGVTFLNDAKKILNGVNSLSQHFSDSKTKVLHIGALPSLSTYLLPNVLTSLQSCGYKTNLMVTNSSDEIGRLFFERKIDAGFAQDIEENEYAYPILEEPYCLVVPANSSLADCKSVGFEELVNRAMILPSYPCDIRKALDNYLNQHDIALEASIEIGQNEPILSLVKANGGLTILPEMAVRKLDDDLKAIPLKEKGFSRTVSLMTYSNKLKDLIFQSL
ncbi:putative LysR family transcriptional regulator [Oscillibacter valericigenes Sjm18-20]|nr:putative LysR family transcriptional regulator [Oscillibacter valericigenes Sjm18-20]